LTGMRKSCGTLKKPEDSLLHGAVSQSIRQDTAFQLLNTHEQTVYPNIGRTQCRHL
jgi:hypothetical protein